MSVYTELNTHEVSALLANYDLGAYRTHKGISAGVENTNYFVSTQTHELVLTIFEKHKAEELPFFLELSEHLHDHGCAVPQPFRQTSGDFIFMTKGKPGVFFERVIGAHVDQTTPHIAEVAKALANVHNVTQTFSKKKPHSHDLSWVIDTAERLMSSLSEADQSILKKAQTVLSEIPKHLPSGIIHADLFHDNTLFNGMHLNGIIDWYFAGNDSYALDIAITMNDWCNDSDNASFKHNCQAFIGAYQGVRALNQAEVRAIPLLQIQSAIRFWLSRLLAQREHGCSSETITVKEPDDMKQLAVTLMR